MIQLLLVNGVVINNLFKDYSAFIVRINELLKQCDLIKSDKSSEFKELLIIIKDDYKPNNEYAQNGLKNIEREIKEEIDYQNRLSESKRVDVIVNKNYEAALYLCKETESNDTRFMDVYSLYAMMYNGVFNKRVKIDDFVALENLSFIDYEKDMELIVSIMLKSNTPRIFIARESLVRSNYNVPRIILNLGGNEVIHLNDENTICREYIKYNDLKNNYISLGGFMKNVYFNGKVIKHEMFGERFLVLYNIVNSDYALVLKENGSIDLMNIAFCNFDNETNVNIDIEKFKDIKELERYICTTILMGANKLSEEEVLRKNK